MIVAIIWIKLFSTWAEQLHTVYAVAAQVQLQNAVTMTKQEIEVVNEYNKKFGIAMYVDWNYKN